MDVPGDMTKLTLETIARTGFGHDFGSFERSRPHPFVTAMVGTLTYAQRLNTVPVPLAPLLLRSARRRNAADIAHLDRTVDAAGPGPARGPAAGTGDLLDRMLETAHPETGERLSPENVRRQVITFLSRATRPPRARSPSPCTTSPATPRSRPGPAPRWTGCGATRRTRPTSRWPELRYVRRVLDESLRLWPTAPAFAREARRGHRAGRGASACGGAPGRWC